MTRSSDAATVSASRVSRPGPARGRAARAGSGRTAAKGLGTGLRVADPKPEFVLVLSGDLDLPHVAGLRATLSSAAARRPERIVIDLADVTFMDTAALRTLIAIRRRCVAGGIGFTLRRPSHVVQRLLTVTRLSTVFDVESPLLAAA